MAIRDGAFFGSSNSTIFLDDVICRGDESNLLLECAHNSIGEHNCGILETAGVFCGGNV